MKKVRIYSLKKELGLDNCTPILNTCQQMGIKAKSASSTITKSQARQVAELLSNARATVLNSAPKTARFPKSERSSSPAAPSKKRSSKSSTAKKTAPPDSKAKIPTTAKTSNPQSAKPSRKTASKPQTAKPSAKSPAVSTASNVEVVGHSDRSSTAVTHKPKNYQYMNGNRVFTLQITGLKGARTRHAITTYSVPYNRLSSEIQRINRSEAKIVDISLSL